MVPFPFVDAPRTKRRPALVLSIARDFNEPARHSVMAMITSARHSPWPLDVHLTDLARAGLPKPSVVRMKLFTLDHRLVTRKIGTLSRSDRAALLRSLEKLIPREA